MLISHDEVLKKLQNKTNLSYELLRLMFNDYWHQMLMHIQHPEDNFIKGIKMRDCIKFRLNPKQVCKAYCNYLTYRYNSDSEYTQNLIKIHNQLLENDIYTEKQKETIQDCERNRICLSREEGYHSDEEE